METRGSGLRVPRWTHLQCLTAHSQYAKRDPSPEGEIVNDESDVADTLFSVVGLPLT